MLYQTELRSLPKKCVQFRTTRPFCKESFAAKSVLIRPDAAFHFSNSKAHATDLEDRFFPFLSVRDGYIFLHPEFTPKPNPAGQPNLADMPNGDSQGYPELLQLITAGIVPIVPALLASAGEIQFWLSVCHGENRSGLLTQNRKRRSGCRLS